MIEVVRITPACAGKTPCLSLAAVLDEGSPPRVRGKRPRSAEDCRANRITPACAGKTVALKKALRLTKDHPRVCGENAEPAGRDRIYRGSPPRVRGKQL